MARVYANENFPSAGVQELRRLGHDVLTTIEAGRANQAIPDADVLALAIAEGRALLTLNRRDFIRLARSTPSHSGVIVCSEDVDFIGQAERIHREIAGLPSLQEADSDSPSGVIARTPLPGPRMPGSMTPTMVVRDGKAAVRAASAIDCLTS